MVIICYFLGQKYYAIPYKINIIIKYFVLSMLLLIPFYLLKNQATLIQLLVNNILVLSFVLYVLYKENMLKRIVSLVRSKLN